VLCGDYNVVPTDELDIYNPRSWKKDALLQPESRDCWARLLSDGWTDALRVLYPGEKIFTFWDYFRQHWEHDSGLRIDHLLLNRTLAPRLRSAGVDRWVRGLPGASDHAPTWIVLGTTPRKTTAKKAPAKKIPAKTVVREKVRKAARKPAAKAAKRAPRKRPD
jgi:exodeoxyribonuclease-3